MNAHSRRIPSASSAPTASANPTSSIGSALSSPHQNPISLPPPQLVTGYFCETYDPTLEDRFRKQLLVDDRACILELMEYPQDSAQDAESRERMVRGSHAIVLAYSVTSRASLASIAQYRSQVEQVRSQLPYAPAPVWVVGTKADDEGEREVAFAEGAAVAGGLGCGFAEVSAKEGTGFERVFCEVVRGIRGRRVEGAAESVESVTKSRKSRLGSFCRIFGR